MYNFKGLIKCVDCGKNYKKKSERGKQVYICSGYANYGSTFCSRYQIEHDRLVRIINHHIGGEVEDVREVVKTIEVKNGTITIKYSDDSFSYLSGDKVVF